MLVMLFVRFVYALFVVSNLHVASSFVIVVSVIVMVVVPEFDVVMLVMRGGVVSLSSMIPEWLSPLTVYVVLVFVHVYWLMLPGQGRTRSFVFVHVLEISYIDVAG